MRTLSTRRPHSTRTGETVTDTKRVVLEYPRNEGNPKFVEVDLMCVRSADGLRISYDFERDGWKIEQAAIFSWDAEDEKCDPDWQEVAFCPAWQRGQTRSAE